MKQLRTIGLCIGLLAGLSLFGCADSATSDTGKTRDNINTEQETKTSIANNSHIPPQARAGVMRNLETAKAAGMGGGQAPK